MSTAAPALSLPSRRIVLADLVPGAVARDVALVVGAAALTGAAAQLSIPMPGTLVPITGQTFAVLLSGAALGPRRGFASMALYLLAGGVGLPWFADHTHGFHLVTFGYIIGFVLASTVVGWIARRGGDRTPARTVATMLLGTVLIYAVGMPYLAEQIHVSTAVAFREGVRPFLLGDTLKVLLAAGLLPGAWRIVGRHQPTIPE
jgi:biotin transport system substrate-specific component